MQQQQQLLGAGLVWICAAVVLLLTGQDSGTLLKLLWYPAAFVAIITPLALLMLIARLFEEVTRLRDLNAREALERRMPQPKIRPAEKPPEKGETRPTGKPLEVRHVEKHDDQQSNLPFGEDLSRAQPSLPADELIAAINFPSDENDHVGIRAMRTALQDPVHGQMVLACQDILTLLGQDGIYMDQAAGRTVRPWHWRRFVEGIRGPDVAELARIGAPDLVDHVTKRVREDTIFRDAVQHFLRLFDRMLHNLVPTLSDGALDRLTETRSARAFMLLGAAMNIFG
jgi:hypothetical protein